MLLTNIDTTHPGVKDLLQKGGIAVARSLLPGSLCDVDKTMEESFMKFSKFSTCMEHMRNCVGPYPLEHSISKKLWRCVVL